MSNIPDINTDRDYMYKTNFMACASFALLVWDHIITFDQEVEYIWPARKSLMMLLFFINRYLTPLGFIVNLYAYLAPKWIPSTCKRLVQYEGAMTVIGLHIVSVMMFIRIKALYHDHRVIPVLLAALGLASFILNTYLLTMGVPVIHHPNSGVFACTIAFYGGIIKLVSSSARLLPIYDTFVLGLTLYKTIPSLRNIAPSFIMRRLIRDGVLYYSVISCIAVGWSIMISLSPPGIQNIVAPPYLLLTVTMMSRITLNLKSTLVELQKVNIARPPPNSHRSKYPSSVRIAIKSTKTTEFDDTVNLRDPDASFRPSDVTLQDRPWDRRHRRDDVESMISGMAVENSFTRIPM